jgi:hypothetical protein
MNTDVKAAIDYDAFRAEIHAFVSTQCPPDIKQIMALNRKLSREPWSRWQKILFARGWGAPNWHRMESQTTSYFWRGAC